MKKERKKKVQHYGCLPLLSTIFQLYEEDSGPLLPYSFPRDFRFSCMPWTKALHKIKLNLLKVKNKR